MVWTREDDIQHDLYYPLSYNYVGVRLDENGQPSRLPAVRSFPMRTGVPVRDWRSVENFARGSFLDELAAERGLDPYELYLALLPDRGRTVVELADTRAVWGDLLPEGG